MNPTTLLWYEILPTMEDKEIALPQLASLKNVKRDALAFELAQMRARVTQPSPHIFLHVCTYNWSLMPPFMHKIKNERKKKRKLLFFLRSFFY